MIRAVPLTVALCLCFSAAAARFVPAQAATGLAWDSVVKMSMDGSVPPPGNFASDFQTAAQTATPPPQRSGLFNAINNAMGAANYALTSMRNGFAARHAVAGNFIRRDDLANQTATIIDCQARTITTLDLAKKTYSVGSLDTLGQNSTGSGARTAPGPLPTDDGSKIAIKMTGSALGPRTIDTVSTDGYAYNVTATVTKPSGESQSTDMTMTSYVSSYAEPSESCGRIAMPAAAPAGMPNTAMYQQIMHAATAPNGDPRVTVSASGPTPPAGKFPMYTTILPKANGRAGFAMLIENGNVHQVSDADKSIFAVPPDFTKIP
jgi:hypothetical protein